jgi:hypothetical protein
MMRVHILQLRWKEVFVEPRIPEKNNRAGLSYAVTDDGLELPVIDTTHPAFACEMTEAEISADKPCHGSWKD